MENDTLTQNIEELQEWVAELQQSSEQLPSQDPNLIVEALAKLNISLEELRVLNEELTQKNLELEAAHLELEQDRQRFHDLFEFAPEGYLVTGADGTVQEANRAAARLLNLPENFLIGKPLSPFVVPEEVRDFRTQLSRLSQVERLEEWSVRLRPREGEPFDAAVTVGAVRDREGELVALRWLLHDVTQRKRAEEERAERIREQAVRVEAEAARERMVGILESMTDAFIALDLEGCLTYLNEKAVRLMRRLAPKSREELIGQNLWELLPEVKGTWFHRACQRAVADQTVVQGEDFFAPFLAWFEVQARPSKVGLSIYLRDVTERKQAEETIRELSTPVLPIGERLLLLPLIGVIDAKRAAQLTDRLLNAIRTNRARAVVIDITGVAFMDSYIANHLVKSVEAARLLGAGVIITGVSAEVAGTLTKIGVDLSAIETVGDLRSAIEAAGRRLGYKFVPITDEVTRRSEN